MEHLSTELLFTTLFSHLGELEPALVCKWLQVGDEFKQQFGFLEAALTLGKVSNIKDEAPVHLLWQVQDSLECQFHHGSESTLLSLLQLSCHLLILVF